MADIRTFIAVLLPGELKREIKLIQDRLRDSVTDVKWVAEENFHVTMKFLGGVEEGRLDEIVAAVEAACVGETPFSVNISGAGAFPNVRRPQVVWVGLTSGVERLAALAGKIETELERLGYPKENRKFSAHITIGRAKQDRRADALAEALQREQVGEIGSFEVGSVALMKSDLRREGPVYSVVREVALVSGNGFPETT